MANDSIQNHYAIQFSAMMHVKAQQKRSRLREMCQPLSGSNADEIYYDGLGTVSAQEVIVRNQAASFSSIDHTRRKVTKRKFFVNLPVDKNDLHRKITDPQGDYANAAMYALERKVDQVIYAEFFSDVYTGQNASTAVSFSSDGGLTVNATGGLTLAKLLEIKQNFIDNEVSIEEDPRVYYGISGDEHTTLLGLSTLTSGDYSHDLPLEKGSIQTAVGMQLIKHGANVSEPLLYVSGSNVRTSYAVAKGGMALWMGDWDIQVQPRYDLIDTVQVLATCWVGAVRTEGVLVQKVTTTNA